MIQEGYRGCVVIASCRLQTTPRRAGASCVGQLPYHRPQPCFGLFLRTSSVPQAPYPLHTVLCECGRWRRPSVASTMLRLRLRSSKTEENIFIISNNNIEQQDVDVVIVVDHQSVLFRCISPYLRQSDGSKACEHSHSGGRIGTEQVSRARLC